MTICSLDYGPVCPQLPAGRGGQGFQINDSRDFSFFDSTAFLIGAIVFMVAVIRGLRIAALAWEGDGVGSRWGTEIFSCNLLNL